MKNVLLIICLIVLTGCNLVPLEPHQINEGVNLCKKYNMEYEYARNGYGDILKVKCIPK